MKIYEIIKVKLMDRLYSIDYYGLNDTFRWSNLIYKKFDLICIRLNFECKSCIYLCNVDIYSIYIQYYNILLSKYTIHNHRIIPINHIDFPINNTKKKFNIPPFILHPHIPTFQMLERRPRIKKNHLTFSTIFTAAYEGKKETMSKK